ncbi:MAG: hypothetical protein WCO85_07265 [Actinomycetes bacterium]
MDANVFELEELENQIEDWQLLSEIDKDFMISQIEILLTEFSAK